MRFTETDIKGAYIIELEKIEDDRGFFARSWCKKEFEEHLLNPNVVQINIGFSLQKGTLRGVHYQLPPFSEVKIVRCTQGAIFDVVVDLRPESSTFKQSIGIELTADNYRMLYVPEGCGHAYQTLVDNTEMTYQATQFYVSNSAKGIRYNDPAFAIQWPLAVTSISDGDRNWPDYLEHPYSC